MGTKVIPFTPIIGAVAGKGVVPPSLHDSPLYDSPEFHQLFLWKCERAYYLNLGPLMNSQVNPTEWQTALAAMIQARTDLQTYDLLLQNWALQSLASGHDVGQPNVPDSIKALVTMYLANPANPTYSLPDFQPSGGTGFFASAPSTPAQQQQAAALEAAQAAKPQIPAGALTK